MKCRDADLLINKYIDGEITEDEAVLLNGHIKECPQCRESFLLYDSIINDLAVIPVPEAPACFENTVMAKIEELQLSPHSIPRIKNRISITILSVFALFLGFGSVLALNSRFILESLSANPNFADLAQRLGSVFQIFSTHTAVIQSIFAEVTTSLNTALSNASGLIILAMASLCAVQVYLFRKHKKSKR